MIFRRLSGLVTAVALALPGVAWAQDGNIGDGARRYPAEGLAILNCAPSDPVPTDSCVLWYPPFYKEGRLSSEKLGEVKGEFKMSREGRNDDFPDGLRQSATLLLIDLSPGPVAQGRFRRSQTFDQEKAFLKQIVNALPRGADVAIYGFNERLTRIQAFTDDRGQLRDAIDGLTLGGSNTRLAASIGDSIDVLARENGALLRDLIVVSDGDEEGQMGSRSVIDKAINAGVRISTIGAFWRRPGDSLAGAGLDKLEVFSAATAGARVQAYLRREGGGTAAVEQFAGALATSIERSGLILPKGTPQPALIKLTYQEPVPGAANDYRTVEASAEFHPAQSESSEAPTNDDAPAKADAQTETEADMLFGLPRLYVLAGAGGLALLVVGLLLWLLARRGRNDDEHLLDDDLTLVDPSGDMATNEATIKLDTPTAYLVFETDGRRVGIAGAKVSVGRSSSNDIVVREEGISRLHAQIYRNREGGYSITDMDSLNGTFVNGKQVSGTDTLRLGDVVTFGETRAKLVAP